MKAKNADFARESQRELAADDLKEFAQHELAAGVLKQAARDLRRFHGTTSKVERELYLDAYRWLMSDDHSWPFSFQNVCQLLNLSPEKVREELIADVSLGAFTYRARRYQRAVSRLRAFLRRLFLSERDESASMPTGYAEARNMVFHNATSVGGSCLYENVN
jgi:hypothetical protein